MQAPTTPFARPTSALLAAAMTLVAVAPSAAQSAEEVMGAMAELDIEFVGIASDIRDRQNIGYRSTPDGRQIVYAWDRDLTADDRVAREHLLAVAHLQAAGIPAVEGASPEFESGTFGRQRYRLGGTITSMDIRGEERYELQMNLDWDLYDSRSSSTIWEGSSRSLQRGAALGDRGEPDNVLLNAVLDALDKVLEDDVPEAIDDDE